MPRTTNGFGTAPVFLAAISTILGAILFLRFGYATGNLGFPGMVAMILLGHMVTIPTALALAEIATNQRVEGGGEYFIISRSFGPLIGAAAGLALYLSQTISIAFYVIAFAEAFGPVFDYLRETFGIVVADPRLISLPTMALLALLMSFGGANVGVAALYAIVGLLFFSLALFFLGAPVSAQANSIHPLLASVENPHSFFRVFAICFPAFTGMTAGVGLSGDLRDPKRAIPLGTLSATLCGMIVYIFVALKLALSASPEDLVGDQLIMARIALWGPIIPIGLACATLSSALGSILVSPRTLQAIAGDGMFPSSAVNRWLAKGKAVTNEPFRATLVSSVLAITFVALGDVDFVAQVISMFFMVTYGSICLISFLEHFAAHPGYRPLFHSRWYISLLGAVACLWLMFEMSAFYASLSLALMGAAYLIISHAHPQRTGLARLFQDAIFQISRQLQVFLQQSRRHEEVENWRPAVVSISDSSFERLAAFDLLRWISHRYGFGTYIHYIEGYLSKTTHDEAKKTLHRLVKMAGTSEGNVYVDTLVSPSYTSAISQMVQLPGVSGKENNVILLEYSKYQPNGLAKIIENHQLVVATDFDVCILATSQRGFGYRKEVHIWLTANDYENAGLMILLAYIILGHHEWKGGIIKVFAIFPPGGLEAEKERFTSLVSSGRLPISEKNIRFIAQQADKDRKAIINENSIDADLTIVGIQSRALKHEKEKVFEGYEHLGNVLFVSASKEILLVNERERGQDAVPLGETGSDSGDSGAIEPAAGNARKGPLDYNDGVTEAGPAPPPAAQRDEDFHKK